MKVNTIDKDFGFMGGDNNQKISKYLGGSGAKNKIVA